MTLVSTSDLITYLKADATTETALIDSMLTGSISFIENYLNTTVYPTSQSDQFNAPDAKQWVYPNQLLLRCYPIVSSSVNIISLYGATLFNYQIDADRGIVNNSIVRPSSFPEYIIYGRAYPFVVTYIGGLQTATDYATRYEPILNQVIREIVFDWFTARNARANTVTEPGITTTYSSTSGVALRTIALLSTLKRKPR